MKSLLEFYSISGRIGRAEYWVMLLIFIFVGLPVAFIVSTAFDFSGALALIAALLLYVPWLVWGLTFCIKRLHDRDKSGWWLLLFSGVPSVLSTLGAIAGSGGIALTLAAFVISVWGGVEIGFLRGTEGPNQYGPDPLATAEPQ
jgi:uncharacterized membrane protein YhaH (DUF805 family)